MQRNRPTGSTRRLISTIVTVFFALFVLIIQSVIFFPPFVATILLMLLPLLIVGAVVFVVLRQKRPADSSPRNTAGTASTRAGTPRNTAETAPTRAERRLRDAVPQQRGESRGSTPEGYVDYYEYRDAATHGTTPEGDYRPQHRAHACGYERGPDGRAADGCISHGTTPEGDYHDRRRRRKPEGPEF